MASVKVITDFSKLRDDQLTTRSDLIVEMMTNNINYPAPVPALAEVKSAIISYRHALAETVDGGKEKTAIKRQKRQALEHLLQALAWYVQINCSNDLSILLSSGFESRKRYRTTVTIQNRPENLKVTDGPNNGTVRLSVNKLMGAAIYVFEYAAVPIDNKTHWTTQVATKRTCVIHGLTSGQRYAFRVAGVGADQTKFYSDVIERYAQ